MANHPDKFYPLEFDRERNEPFLRLPAPHSNIIITPPRVADEDISAIVTILNDVQVTKWLQGPPYPYKPEHARDWLQRNETLCREIIQSIEVAEPNAFIDGCPVRILREIKEDGQEIYLGDCGIDGWGFEDIGNLGEKRRLMEENDGRKAGDAEKEWTIGDYLAPTHHGKGIMTLAVSTLLEQWIKPRMNAKRINTTVFKGNIGSLRVFEKNGFVLEKTLEDWVEIAEDKGGGRVGLHILRWKCAK